MPRQKEANPEQAEAKLEQPDPILEKSETPEKGKKKQKPREPITRDDVIMAFKIILGRVPEDDKVIENHRIGSLEELRVVLIKSREFAEKYNAINSPAAKPSTKP